MIYYFVVPVVFLLILSLPFLYFGYTLFHITWWQLFSWISYAALILLAITIIACLILLVVKKDKTALVIMIVMSLLILPGQGYRQYIIHSENNGEVRIYRETIEKEINVSSDALAQFETFYKDSIICIYEDFTTQTHWSTKIISYYNGDYETYSIKRKKKTSDDLIASLDLSESYISLSYEEFKENYDLSLKNYIEVNSSQVDALK